MDKKENTLGNKIRLLRKSKGLTQEQLAECLGADSKHLSRIEKGYHKPNYEFLQKFAQFFDIDIRDFEDISVEDIPMPDKFTIKSIQILNSAKNDKEKEYYFSVLKLAHKGLKLNLTEKN